MKSLSYASIFLCCCVLLSVSCVDYGTDLQTIQQARADKEDARMQLPSDPTGEPNDTEPKESGNMGKAGCQKIPLDPIDLPDLTQGPSVVTLDADGFFIANGTRFFPYGFYGNPSTQEDMDDFLDAGFNFSIFYGNCCSGNTLQNQIDTFTWLQQNGVMGSAHAFSPVDQIYNETIPTLTDWLNQRNDTGSVLFWYTYDEPGIWSRPYQEVEDYHQLLHDIDSDHPNALVMAPVEEFSEYVDYTDFLMIDPYPTPMMPLSQVKYAILEATEACAPDKRVFGVGQAFDWYDSWGTSPEGHIWRPYVWEMRNMTYQFLVFGVHGLVYFAYNYVHAQPERWEGLKLVANEVRELMPVLLNANSNLDVVQSPDVPYVDYALKEFDGNFYLLVVSTWPADITVTYDLSELGQELCVIRYFEDEQVEISELNTVTIELPRYGEAVLQIIP